MEIKCLDHGFVALVDTMGTDRTPAQCARTSFRNAGQDRTEEQDAKLTNYLVRNHHTTPLEFVQARFYIKAPIFVARQIMRHRTACLTGDMRVSFDAPKSKKQRPFHYPLTVAEIYKKWSHPSRRARVQSMQLRQVDETTGSLRYSRVVDIWSNGIKAVYKLTLSTGEILRCTLNHRLLTDQGWLIAEDAIKRRAHVMVVGKQRSKEQVLPTLTDDSLANEEWRECPGLPNYDVSSMGRVRSWTSTRRRRKSLPSAKRLTTSSSGYHIVNAGGKTHLVSRLVLSAFVSPAVTGREARHLDGNRRNNRVSNLAWGTTKENANDRMVNGNSQRLSTYFSPITSAEPDGQEEVFDLEVEGPFHNFVANNCVVHNSINEVSYRYVEAKPEFYVPDLDKLTKRPANTKQGRSDELVDTPYGLQREIRYLYKEAFDSYEALLRNGLAPEVARIVLPLGTYTEWYWQNDMNNILKFLSLRLDDHAQYETRVYAQAVHDLLLPRYPNILAAWRAGNV